jgi:alpha-glucosidase
VPTTFDETVAIDGKLGEYAVIARKKDNTWYIGGMSNWTARDVVIDLSFIGEGNYSAEIFRDGINADRNATDYKKETILVNASRKLDVHLAPGGGFAIRITKQ